MVRKGGGEAGVGGKGGRGSTTNSRALVTAVRRFVLTAVLLIFVKLRNGSKQESGF